MTVRSNSLPMLAGMLFLIVEAILQPVQAMPGFIDDLMQVCARFDRPRPVLNAIACTSCHGVADPTSQGGSQTLQTAGLIFQSYRNAPVADNLDRVLNTFCKGAYYNLRYNENDRLNNGGLPPLWSRSPETFNYKGSLQVHWLAELGGDDQRQVLSRQEAALNTAQLPETFNLLASPENCWGEKMNFGLIRLARKANLTLRIEADATQHSSVIPGFAFYRGWDESRNAQNHDTIILGDNNPLSTAGLTFMGQALAGKSGEAAEKTFVGLEPGQYEVFVTVGTNQSSLGEYTLTLTTTPPTSGLNISKIGNGAVTSQPKGIDCGPVCSAAFEPGHIVTLTATPQSGYRFTAWDGCPDSNGVTCRIPLDYTMALTARFEPILQRLTIKTGGNGKVYSLDSKISCGQQTLGLCQGFYPQGTAVTLIQQGNFKNWSGACSGQAKRCELTLNADLCVAANFAGATAVNCETTPATNEAYDLTVAVKGQGRVAAPGLDCRSICTTALMSGQNLTLTATPEPGYRFVAWSGACTGNQSTCTLSGDADHAVTALFEPADTTANPGSAAQCGTINNALVTQMPQTAGSLCLRGRASRPVALKDGRYTWLCRGDSQATASSRCYTLGANGKQNQPPLSLSPSPSTVQLGHRLELSIQGGAGTGAIHISQTSRTGTQCKISRKGMKVTLSADGQPGTCTLIVARGANSSYNAAESAPTLITVTAGVSP